MDYLTTIETAARLGVTRGRVLKLCQQGRFPGAERKGRDWLIPEASVAAWRPRPVGRPGHRSPVSEAEA